MVAVMVLGAVPSAMAWGAWSHRLVAYIAKDHLTPKAKATVEHYIGDNMVKDATWMDRVASWTKKSEWHIPGYYETSSWHMVTVDKNLRLSNARKYTADGDLLPNLGKCIERLKNYRELSDSAVVTNLRCVLHMVGDMHCPSHTYYLEFPHTFGEMSPAKGGGIPRIGRNDQRSVIYNGKKTTYHKVWDGLSIRALYPKFGAKYEPYRDEFEKLYSPAQIKKICKGTIEDWALENARNIRPIYDWIEERNHDIDTAFLEEHRDLSISQLMKSAYRLAHVLNECFK